jgi:hypothetical protein
MSRGQCNWSTQPYSRFSKHRLSCLRFSTICLIPSMQIGVLGSQIRQRSLPSRSFPIHYLIITLQFYATDEQFWAADNIEKTDKQTNIYTFCSFSELSSLFQTALMKHNFDCYHYWSYSRSLDSSVGRASWCGLYGWCYTLGWRHEIFLSSTPSRLARAHITACTMGTWCQSGRGVKPTTRLHLV